MDTQIITPWKVEKESNGKFNYDRLINQFGVDIITDELLNRFEKVTGHKAHIWMKRKLFFAHRQLDEILTDYENGKQIFLYTGRGPSPTKNDGSSMHIGHLIPFKFIKWLQDVFNAIVVIQIADDEKYYFKDTNFETVYKLGFENAKDIIACGFNPDKTFIFSNRDFSKNISMHNTIHDILKHTHINTIQSIFGIESNACLGQLMWPVYQTAPAFSRCFQDIFKDQTRCLVTYAIDQDPFFRLSRDIASKLNSLKPCSIIGQFLPSLTGKSKMSTTETGQTTTIFLTDSEDMVRNKIKRYAFSGGQDTAKLHKELGANLDVDISYQWLIFFEEDDIKLQSIAKEYSSGKMFTKEIKDILSDKVIIILKEHQKSRELITDELLTKFYDITKFTS